MDTAKAKVEYRRKRFENLFSYEKVGEVLVMTRLQDIARRY